MRTLDWLLEKDGFTQRGFAEAFGLSSHTEITRWRSGAYEPRPDVVFEIERFLDVPPGTLSLKLGYLPPDARPGTASDAGFEEVVSADPLLSDRDKEMLKMIYAMMRSASGA